MIESQTLRQPFYGATGEMQIAEAFAYCYATRFADGPIPFRMEESFKRAWDHDFWTFVPRALAGRPAYVKVTWGGDFRNKIMIAISGFGGWTSLLPIRASYLAGPYALTPLTALPGIAFGVFKDYADAIWNDIVGSDTFYGAISAQNPVTPLVITGLSMGGAVAEVLAARIRASFPLLNVRLIKFAAPLVGNLDWQNHVERSQRESVYVDNDPIQLLPQAAARMPTPLAPAVFSWFIADRNKTVLRYDGQAGSNYRLRDLSYTRSALLIPTGDPATTSPWFNHMWETYRMAISRLVRRSTADTWYRFGYLEFPGDNVWGQRIDNADDWRPWIEQTVPAPEDVNLAPVRADLLAGEQIRPREATLTVQNDEGIGGGGGPWGEALDEGIGGSGGPWGEAAADGLGGGGDWALLGQDENGFYSPLQGAPTSQQPPPMVRVMSRRRDRRPINPGP